MATMVTRTTAIRTVGDASVVNQTTAGSQLGGQSATLASGNYVVTWLDYGFGGTPVAKARIFAPDGTARTAEFAIVGVSSIAAL